MIKKALRYIVANNSCYLLSGLCLLFGCYLLIGDRPVGANLLPDLALLGTMKVYEILVTVFACLVLRRFRVEADGILLSCMAVALYLDPTLFNTRFHGAGKVVGLLVNGSCLALALVGMRVLSGVGGVPISRAAFRGVGTGAACIYLTAAFLDLDASPLAKGAAPSQDHIYYLLWLAPLVTALAARRWLEDGPRLSETADPLPGVHIVVPVDRYRYLDVVLTYFPFLLLVRHLFVMQDLFSVKMYAANVAPVVLGIAVLADRTFTRMRVDAPLVFVGAGWLAILVSGDATPLARMQVAGAALGPVHLIAFLNVAAGLWLFGDTGRRVYLYHALVATVPLLSGSANILQAAANLEASFLVPVWIATIYAALRTRSFGDVLVAGWMTLLVGVRAGGLAPATAIGAWTHGAAWWLLALGYAYRERRVIGLTAEISGFLMGTTFIALHAARAPHAALLPYLAVQSAFFLALGARSGDARTRNSALAFGGLETGLRGWGAVRHVDFAALAKSCGGVGMMVLAFGGLFLGVWVSMNKHRLMSWLADEADAPRA